LDELAGVVFVTDERQCDREGAALMTLDQLPEGSHVTLLRSRDECTVFLRFSYSGLLRVGRVRNP
jgi:hypothetical protein